MSNIKKIKEGLNEVTPDELGKTLSDMEDRVKQELQTADDEEVEDIVKTAVIGGKKDTTTMTQSSLSEVNDEVMQSFIDQYGEKGKNIYYATANKQDRDPETFHVDEIEGGTGEDFGDIPTGRDIEAGELDYEELNQLIADINAMDDLESGDMGGNLVNTNGGEDVLPFEESVNPRMTKDELIESIRKHSPKKTNVIKKVKVKDIRNGR